MRSAHIRRKIQTLPVDHKCVLWWLWSCWQGTRPNKDYSEWFFALSTYHFPSQTSLNRIFWSFIPHLMLMRSYTLQDVFLYIHQVKQPCIIFRRPGLHKKSVQGVKSLPVLSFAMTVDVETVGENDPNDGLLWLGLNAISLADYWDWNAMHAIHCRIHIFVISQAVQFVTCNLARWKIGIWPYYHHINIHDLGQSVTLPSSHHHDHHHQDSPPDSKSYHRLYIRAWLSH